MPIEISYVDGGKGVILTGRGVVTGQEMIDAKAEIYAAHNLSAHPYLYGFFDANGMTAIRSTTKELRASAGWDRSVSRQLPWMVIAVYAKDDVTFGLARMWQAYVEDAGWRTRVFRDRSEAMNWLRAEVFRRSGVEIECCPEDGAAEVRR